ncbi:MAG TPA: hypothetical protein VL001_12165 [Candidimonas sp.]|nr:hypothetical protein [Candidimonas sp.]
MQASALYQTLKAVSYLVLVMGGASMGYAAYIAIKYWSGIGV